MSRVDRSDRVDVVEFLEGFEPAVADPAEVTEALDGIHRLVSWLEAKRMNCRRRLDTLATSSTTPPGAPGMGAGVRPGSAPTASAESDMAGASGRSTEAARKTAERSRVCHDFPDLETMLASGDISVEHLDALAKATRNLDDRERSDLIAATDRVVAAASGYVSSFEHAARRIIKEIQASHREHDATAELDRQRKRSRVRRWNDPDTGMYKLLVELDPLRAAQLEAALDARFNQLRQLPENADRSSRDLEVEALLTTIVTPSSAAATTRTGDTPFAEGEPRDETQVGGPRADISILVDAESFSHGPHDHTICETTSGTELPVRLVDELCCDARLTAVILDADGTVRCLGKEIRTANRKQRRALAAMYRTCVHPDCKVPFSRCRIHHVQWFSEGGPTLIANLVPICEKHHHQVHEGGWQLTIDPDRTITWAHPNGSTWWKGDPRDRQPPSDSEESSSKGRSSSPSSNPSTNETWQQPQLC